jgi:hypothetical protein
VKLNDKNNNSFLKKNNFNDITIITLYFSSNSKCCRYKLTDSHPGGINDAISTVDGYDYTNNTIILNPGTYNKTTDRNNISFNNKNLIIQGNGSKDSVIIDAQILEECLT